MEELAELIQCLSKIYRYEDSIKNYEHLSEEMADVEIILAQLKLMYKNQREIDNIKRRKIERLDRLMRDKLTKDNQKI